MIPDLATLTVDQAGRHMAAGDFSAGQLVEALLAAIAARDGDLGAYTSLDADGARRQAEAADRARAAGATGPLLGVPVAVKDNLNVEGQPCTNASRILEGYIAPYDATVIARLRAAGAIFLGRTNMDEFAMGGSTENSALRVTRNPRHADHVPGGSSGGSAAAVAGGLALCALGSDTGGSIRQPAAFCGCVGLKPSYGRVSRYGLTAFASSLDQIGPLTHSVRDAALLLETLAGPDPHDATALDLPVPPYAAQLTGALAGNLAGLTLGVPAEYLTDGLDPRVARVFQDAVERCRDLGATIRDVRLPHTGHAIAVYYIIATAEASANLARFDGVRYGARCASPADPLDLYRRTRAAGFGPEVKRRIILGTYVLSSGYYDAYYLAAQKVRTRIRQDFEQAFAHCDALLTPCTPTPAFRFGEKTADPLQMYLSDIFTVTANLAGICGLSVPAGATAEGLPIGLQVLGPAFEEARVLRVGHAFETARGPGWLA